MFGSKKYPSQLPKFLALVILLALPQLAHSFVFTVNNASDIVDATPGDGICATAGSACTLRAAIQEANAWPGNDYIILPDPTTLTPASSQYQLSIAGSDDVAAMGDLDITDSLVLHGAGSALTIVDGGAISRVFQVMGTATATLFGLHIRNGVSADDGGGIHNNGTLTLNNCIVANNTTTSASNGGGGLFNMSKMTLNNVTVDNNSSAANPTVGNGGGIATNQAASVLIINNSTISNNTAVNNGGGMFINAGTVTINDTTISSNSVNRQTGGGIYNAGILTISDSTISANQGYQGGGIRSLGSLTISNSTISGNLTPELWESTPATTGRGAGLYLGTAALLRHVTIANNRANWEGGGIYVNAGILSINNSLLSGNSKGFTTDPMIIGPPPSIFPPAANNCDFNTGSLSSGGNNVADDSSCTGLTNITASLITVPALDSNGGPTQTHALSGLTDADDNGDCSVTTVDQRGIDRLDISIDPDADGGCDSGAYERTTDEASWSDLALHVEDFFQPAIAGGVINYRISITNRGPNNNASTSIGVQNILPTGVSYSSHSGDGSYDSGTNIWTINTLNKSAAKTLLISGTISPSATTITSTPSLVSGDANNNNDSDTVITPVATSTDLGISTRAQVDGTDITEAKADTVFDYHFDIENLGPETARNITLSVQLPTNISIVTTPSGCSVSANILECTVAELTTGLVITRSLSAKPTVTSGSLSPTARVNFDGIDSSTANNISTLISTLSGTIDLIAIPKSVDMGVTITPSASTVVEGSDISFIITVTNHGPDNASGVQMNITLPPASAAQLNTLVSDKDGQGRALFTCTGSTPKVCTLDESLVVLDSGDSASITLLFTTIDSTPSSNTLFDISASVTSTLAIDAIISNDSVSVTTTATEAPIDPLPITDLDLSLTAGPEQIYVGDPVTVTATVEYIDSGGTPQAATSILITFNLPNSVTLQVSSLPQECTATGSIVVCDWSSATVWPNGAVSSHIIVTPDSAGTIGFNVNTVNNDGTDPDPNNNAKTIAVTVDPDPGFRPQDGSGCFIATAAYGSYLDSHVMALRHFRDNVLLTNRFGTRLVEFYYRTSPPIAAYISEHGTLRSITRWALTPLIYAVEYPLTTTLSGLILISGFIVGRRRRLRAQG